MTSHLAKVALITATVAAALALASCNTVSGLGQDLQDASGAVQGAGSGY